MKYMAHILALSILCTAYGDVHGIDEKRWMFDSTTAMFFGGIVCLCCVVFYIFHQNEKIGQLAVQLAEEKNRAAKRLKENMVQGDEINKKLREYFELHQQYVQKEDEIKQLRLTLDRRKDRFTNLVQKSTDKGKRIKEMRHIHSLQHQQDADEIKKLRLRLNESKQFFENLVQANTNQGNKINQLQQGIYDLSQKYEKLRKKFGSFEGEIYSSFSSSSSSAEECVFFLQNND